MRVGLIGCGRICEFHVPALKAAGFNLTAVCSRPGSSRVHKFADNHGIPKVFDSYYEMLGAPEEWDALLIAPSIGPTMEILSAAIETGAPILVEKPIAFHSAELKPLLGRNLPVMVGYNRRFYHTVQEARKEASCGSPLMARMNLPESIQVPHDPSDNPQYLKNFFNTSVHGLDMLRFIFGEIRVECVQQLLDSQSVSHGIAAVLRSENGSIIQFSARWQTPENFGLSMDRDGRRFELRPFESAVVYEGMEVVERTPETPIRTYRPKAVQKIDLDECDMRYKPGFLAEAHALAELIKGGSPQYAARLEDAYAALTLAEQLAGEYPALEAKNFTS